MPLPHYSTSKNTPSLQTLLANYATLRAAFRTNVELLKKQGAAYAAELEALEAEHPDAIDYASTEAANKSYL